jgi:hypothetical protein
MYEVYGFDRTDIAATLISLSPLNVDEIWRETKHSASFTHTEQQRPSE